MIMKKVYAEFNHARWIVRCPLCAAQGITAAMIVAPGDVFICPEEYPDILATAFAPNPALPGTFTSIADPLTRQAARQAALEAGAAYEVIFPEERTLIENALRMRPRGARNWVPGVLLADIQIENMAQGVSNA
jgi:hypothetical protein